MKFTISDCVERLNQILNYPSVQYTDVSHFFDQAISEINSELHTGLRPISELYKKASFKLEDLKEVIVLDKTPATIPVYATYPENPTDSVFCVDNKIYYKKGSSTDYTETVQLYGIVSKHEEGKVINLVYKTYIVGGTAMWIAHESLPENNLNLLDYLPYDWIVLFLIPYVCFKYAIRDGDSGASYAEDFGNGFQQLRNSYDIPHSVVLAQQAGKVAYKQDVEERLPNINTIVPTRAIYEDMKIPRNIQAQYGSVFDRGGWGF